VDFGIFVIPSFIDKFGLTAFVCAKLTKLKLSEFFND